MSNIIKAYQKAYEEGKPLITDAEYDKLVTLIDEESMGVTTSAEKNQHEYQLYSLEKKFDDEVHNLDSNKAALIESPKLDGCAVSLWYEHGYLIKATKRGDGIEGDDCSQHFIVGDLVPKILVGNDVNCQITGEVVMPKVHENARNKASGALGLKDMEEFKTREIYFIAYGLHGGNSCLYTQDMQMLSELGFKTVLTTTGLGDFPQDGRVFRIDNNNVYDNMGFTNKHPKGAYARKLSSDVAIEETILREVIWQVGKNGKVTPVAFFDNIFIDGAQICRATLHNAGFIEDMGLCIGDTILVTRSGGIIPKVLGKL
jgi:NAD-dependent DNA ligase